MKHCIACGGILPETSLFELTSAPASAQDIPDAKEVQNDEGVTLHLRQCSGCGLVQFDCEPVAYYRDVIRAGGGSSTMRELRASQYRHLIETYHLEGKTFFEREDQRFGHSPEASMLPESGWSVPEKPFDVFLSFNFLEHQPRPDIMLKAIWNNLAEDGMGLVTVPSLEYILEKGSYYELIRDHIAYYTFDTLRALLNHCGFEVLEEEMINRDTLSMVVRKMAMPETDADAGAKGAGVSIIAPLTEGYEIVTAEVRALTERLAREGKRLAMWGASHQGFTLASTSELGKHLAYIIDSAPFKQGRFAPASHVPIMAPDHYFEEPVDAILIVAPGYTDEIAGIIKTRFGGKVETMTLRTNRIEHL